MAYLNPMQISLGNDRFREASNNDHCRTGNQWVAIFENHSHKDIHRLSHCNEFREHDDQPAAGRLLSLPWPIEARTDPYTSHRVTLTFSAMIGHQEAGFPLDRAHAMRMEEERWN